MFNLKNFTILIKLMRKHSMKKIYIFLTFILTGCAEYPSQEDLNYRKYTLATDESIAYMSQNFRAMGSDFRKSYSEDFSPGENIKIEDCMDQIHISKDQIIPGKKFIALHLGSWELNDETPISYNAFRKCLKQQIDKQQLIRENLEVFASDFNQEKMKGKFQQADLNLIESKLAEIKKDGIITLGEALETYKLSDQLSLKNLLS